MKRTLLTLLLFSCFLTTYATGLKIENVRYNYVNIDGQLKDFSAEFSISWDNAWRNARNHDAAWVFFKLSQPDAQDFHPRIDPGRLQAVSIGNVESPKAELRASPDSLGFYVYPAGSHRGKVYWNVKVHFKTPTRSFKAWEYTLKVQGIEMVYIPQGPFTLGDPDTSSLLFNAFYRSGPNGEFSGLYPINSEKAVEVGPAEGALYYRSEEAIYNGDQQGPIACVQQNK